MSKAAERDPEKIQKGIEQAQYVKKGIYTSSWGLVLPLILHCPRNRGTVSLHLLCSAIRRKLPPWTLKPVQSSE